MTAAPSASNTDLRDEQIHFITGRLAAPALRRIVQELSDKLGFRYTIQVLPITVAALMTPRWIAKKLEVPAGTTRVVLPGYCGHPLDELSAVTDVPLQLGPRDMQRLPEFFGQPTRRDELGSWNIEIIAEINHAPKLEREELLRRARRLADAGADVIDVGCEPGGGWRDVGDAVRALRDAGLRVSIDSFDAAEVRQATKAGAELVLSVNSTNRQLAVDWGTPVVAIPDHPDDLASLDKTIEFLACREVPLRIDPILEPIGCGFAASLGRYLDVRRRYPDAEIMMGIGNLTEMTDADSAPINTLLLGFCQESGIRSVLTTQVINWARSSVRECDLARRLVHYAVARGVPPKHLDPRLVLLRDTQVTRVDPQFVRQLASNLRDHHVRIVGDTESLHMISAGIHCQGRDPFALFSEFADAYPRQLDAAHAFYLGYEMAKAATAMTLGKQYTQDEPLDWGLLTTPESSHAANSRADAPRQNAPTDDDPNT